jgi:hypothetical protein
MDTGHVAFSLASVVYGKPCGLTSVELRIAKALKDMGNLFRVLHCVVAVKTVSQPEHGDGVFGVAKMQ